MYVTGLCRTLFLIGMALLSASVHAQGVGADYRTDRDHGIRKQEEGLELRAANTSWELSFFAPLTWLSNVTSASTGLRSGLEVAPEMSLARSWQFGNLTLSAEGGVFVSTVLSMEGYDSSGWFGSAILSAGDQAEGVSPYLSYEPVSVYTDVFGKHDLTRHSVSIGLARSIEGTYFDGFATRSPGSASGTNRTSFGLTVSQYLQVGNAALLVRAEAENRYYDRSEGFDGRREVARLRLRAEALLPIDPAVDLSFAAEIQRYSSNDPDWDFTNVLIGPKLVARFGF